MEFVLTRQVHTKTAPFTVSAYFRAPPHVVPEARRILPDSQAGFRPGRCAPEQSIVITLQREQAIAERRPWYRGYVDFKGFFQSIVRKVQKEVEARCGVEPKVTDAVIALHEALLVSYDTGAGLTPGVESHIGNGQGDSDGPVRSIITLAVLSKAVDWLCPGFTFKAPFGAEGMRVPQVWFADDGSFCTVQPALGVHLDPPRARPAT